MFLPARHSPFSDVLPKRPLHLNGRSKRTQLFSKPIISTVERCLKAERLRKLCNYSKRRKARDPTITNRAPLRAQALIELGRRDEARRADQVALERIEKHLELNPDEARAYSLGASVLIRLGETERSKQWTHQAMTLAPNDPLILYNAACNWALLGESDHALDGLERALDAGVAVGDWIRHDPDFASLRDHPRFQAIVKRIAPS